MPSTRSGVYAEAIFESIVKRWVPFAYEAFCDYRLNGGILSADALAVVRTLVADRRKDVEALRENSGIVPREWREFMETLGFES